MRSLVLENAPGILTYGITPPKQSLTPEKGVELAQRQTERIRRLPVDALVVYDIQDESLRTDAARPFPYSPCVDPTRYALEALHGVTVPKVVYRAVPALSEPALRQSLAAIDEAGGSAVLVGAASRLQTAGLTLSDGYQLAQRSFPGLPIGGVLIAERHQRTQAEHERARSKVAAGCRYFVSQAVYSVAATKDLLSDMHYSFEAAQQPMPPVLITLSPCGSLKTLEFLRWLGITVPRWLENDLRHSKDILRTSLDVCREVLADLHDFAAAKRIPLGCNVESVSLSKVEIDASVELVAAAARILGRSSQDV